MTTLLKIKIRPYFLVYAVIYRFLLIKEIGGRTDIVHQKNVIKTNNEQAIQFVK